MESDVALSRRWRLQGTILLAAVAIAYVNALPGVFQYDDYNVIVNAKAVHSFKGWLSDLPRGIRPFLKLTYTLNWTTSPSAWGFHLVNIAIHAANTLLVFALARRFLTRIYQRRDTPHGELVPFTAALLFALHPAQTEAVTYISSRSTSLMALFYLASLLAYAKGSDGGGTTYRLGSLLLFIFALLTKETAVTLPAALLLWESAGRRSGEPWRSILRRQALHWGTAILLVALLLARQSYGNLLLFSFATRSLHDNLLSQTDGIGYLLGRLVCLASLNIDPDIPVVHHMTGRIALAGGLLLTLTITGFARLRRRPILSFAILWFFLHLLPTNSLVPRLDVANERQLYLADWGIFLAVAVTLERLLAPISRSWLRGVARLGVAALLMAFTVVRNHDYRSEIALWEDTARKSPRKARVYNNLGYAYYLAGRHQQARDAYVQALRVDPGYRLARDNLATNEAAVQRKALEEWQRFLAVFPPDVSGGISPIRRAP